MSNKTKNFVKGAAILGIIGLICKVIGAIFRIPLANAIDVPNQVSGMAYYQLVYPVYAGLLVISTAGLPAAISKMVSERRANDDYKGAKEVFTTSIRLLFIIGIASTVLLFLTKDMLANLMGMSKAGVDFMAISPALFFVAIISAYRGYFQGMQMMAPTGFSQLIEQLIKLFAGLYFAKRFLYMGPEYGAAGALLGVSISEALALLFLFIIYQIKKPAISKEIKQNTFTKGENRKTLLKILLRIAIPVTLGACIMPIVATVDSIIVIRGLKSVGFTEVVASHKFSYLTAYINPLINMPAVLSLALAMSLVPAISAYRTKGLKTELKKQSSLGFKIALLVGLPCAVGFAVLAKQILSLLYTALDPSDYTGQIAIDVAKSLDEAGVIFMIMAIGVLMLTMLQTMTGILQGLGRVRIPVINLAIGAVLKIIISVVLIRIPSININGAAIGTVTCYGVAAILDIYYVTKYTGMKLKLKDHFIKPVVCAVLMGVVVYLVYPIAYKFVDSNTISTLAAIVVGAVVYLGALLFTKTVSKQEIDMIRGKKA